MDVSDTPKKASSSSVSKEERGEIPNTVGSLLGAENSIGGLSLYIRVSCSGVIPITESRSSPTPPGFTNVSVTALALDDELLVSLDVSTVLGTSLFIGCESISFSNVLSSITFESIFSSFTTIISLLSTKSCEEESMSEEEPFTSSVLHSAST